MMYATVSGNGEIYGIVRLADITHIPTDPSNIDYQQYLAWLEEGNVPEEWNPEEVE
jgi:hypothetical protein